MQATPDNQELDGHSVRHSTSARARAEQAQAKSADYSPSIAPILLTDEQAAQSMGISRRKFHELRDQAFMPRPIVLGPRIVRWSRVELEQALASMPRQEQANEPAQLRRGRIEAMKRGGAK